MDNLDNSPYGSGWTLHNVDRLVVQSGGATLLSGSGNMLFFQQSQDGSGMGGGPTFATPISEWGYMNLVQNDDGSYTLTFHDESQETFTAAGLLSTAVDKNGNQTSYQWNPDGTLASTTNQAGQTTSFSYTNGMLASVVDFAGRVTDYPSPCPTQATGSSSTSPT